MESVLSKRTCFAGDEFAAADIRMNFPLEGTQARGVLGADHPSLKAFMERIHARPGYRRALDRGGPHTLLQ